MFKEHLPEFVRWLVVMALQVALAVVSNPSKKRNFRFIVYLRARAVASPILLLVAIYARDYYALIYYLLSALWYVLLALVAEEVLRNVFCRTSLHSVLKKRLALMLVLSYSLAISSGATWRSTNSIALLNAARDLELVLVFAMAATFIALRLFARRIGFVWRHTDAAIGNGLIVFLALEFISVLVSNASREAAYAFNALTQYAWMATLVYWGTQIPRKEKTPARMTADEARSMMATIANLQSKNDGHLVL